MLAPFDPDLNDNSHESQRSQGDRLLAQVSTLITDGYRIR
jgi:hypothetical protein